MIIRSDFCYRSNYRFFRLFKTCAKKFVVILFAKSNPIYQNPRPLTLEPTERALQEVERR